MPRARRFGRRSSYSLAKNMRGYLSGLLFLAFAVFIVSVVSYFMTIIPESYIYVTSYGEFGAGPQLPRDAVGVSSTLILGIIGWGVGIMAVLTALARLKLRL